MKWHNRPQRPEKQRGPLRRGIGFVLGGPIACLGYRQIVDNATTIKTLFGDIREGPEPDRRVRVTQEGTLDVAAMAWEAQLPQSEIERKLENRKRQTKRAAFYYLLGAALFLAFTLYHAFAILPALPTMSFVASMTSIFCCFCSMAFYNALVNWQVRTRRLGSAREFLNTDDTWWPS